MKPSRFTARAASTTCARLTDRSKRAMLSCTVPENRNSDCGIVTIRRRSSSGAMSRTSTPSTSTAPPPASYSRLIRLITVDLPEPVEPTSAIRSPGRTWNDRSVNTGASGT